MYLKNPTSVITSILMLLVVLSLSGSRSVCWSSSTWRGTEGDGGIGGMPTHFATDDDDGKHGARLGPPGCSDYVHAYYENRLEEEEICSSTFCCWLSFRPVARLPTGRWKVNIYLTSLHWRDAFTHCLSEFQWLSPFQIEHKMSKWSLFQLGKQGI